MEKEIAPSKPAAKSWQVNIRNYSGFSSWTLFCQIWFVTKNSITLHGGIHTYKWQFIQPLAHWDPPCFWNPGHTSPKIQNWNSIIAPFTWLDCLKKNTRLKIQVKQMKWHLPQYHHVTRKCLIIKDEENQFKNPNSAANGCKIVESNQIKSNWFLYFYRIWVR